MGGLAAWASTGVDSALTGAGLARVWAGLPEVGAGGAEGGRPTAWAAHESQSHALSDRDGPTQSDRPTYPAPAQPAQPSPLPRQPALTQSRPHQLMLAQPMQPSLCNPVRVSSARFGTTYVSWSEWTVVGFKIKHLGKYT